MLCRRGNPNVFVLSRISLYREELPREKVDSGLINSLVSFIVASSEAPRSLSKEVRVSSELTLQRGVGF